MKKAIALLIAAVFLTMSLAACGSEKKDEPTSNTSGNTSTTTTTEPIPDEPWDNPTPEDAFEFANGIITKYVGSYEIVRVPRRIGGVEVTSIGEGAFAKSGITELYLPSNVKRIENNAFEWTESLKFADLGLVESIGDEAFLMSRLESVTISPECKTIGNKAFQLYSKNDDEPVVDVIIPASVEALGDRAFADSRFRTITFEGLDMPKMTAESLAGVKSGTTILVSDTYTEDEALAVMQVFYAAGLTNFPEVKRLDGSDLFMDYSDDFDYTLVSGMGARVNGYLGSSENVIIPATMGGEIVYLIRDSAFDGNENIKSVTLPKGLVEIGGYAFRNCVNLESIVIPDNVRTVGPEAFAGTSGMKSAVIGAEEIAYAAFLRSGLETLTISDGTQIIENRVFEECANLKIVTMGKNVREIGESAFEDCISLEAIDFLPEGLKEIKENTFDSCYSVSEIRIPEGVTHIRRGAFRLCGAMWQTMDEWPNPYYLYYSKDPKGEIGDKLLQDTSKLPKFVSIYLPSTIKYLGYEVFSGVSIDGLYLPVGMREVSQLPEFDGTFDSIKFIMQIYLDDGATKEQVDAMDQFFMGIDEVGDACGRFDGWHPYYTTENLN